MSPRPPSSTLFPYTTLFRSQKKTNEALKTFQLANTITPSFPDAWYWIGRCQEILGDKAEAKQSYEKAYELEDRKSTRLNSSHLVISYAVFCLKKKKITQ